MTKKHDINGQKTKSSLCVANIRRIYKPWNCSLLSCMCAQPLSLVWLFATLWTVARQALPSRGFSRQEQWSGLPCPPLGGLLDLGIKPSSSALQVDYLPSELPGKPLSCLTILKSSTHFSQNQSLVCLYCIPCVYNNASKRVGAQKTFRDFLHQ